MVAYLSKSDASKGFNQIIDFLNGSYIAYALTVNPTIYVSCLKQFWRTVAVKSSNDVTRLQALVDKKKVVVTKAAIRDALHLDDAEGVDCLPNEEIFPELARMGYEKPTTKLTFYKAFFSSQWKFLIHTILQSMSAKRTSWNEFSSEMASVVICLSTGRKFNLSKYIFESLVRNVDSSTKIYMYPRVEKGCSRVETPLFKGMLVAREPEEQGDVEEQGNEEEHGNVDTTTKEPETAVPEDAANDQPIPSPTPLTPPPQQPQDEALDAYAALARRVEHLEHDNLRRLRKVRTSQRVDTSDDTLMEDVSNQGRVFDRDEDVVKETKEVREYTTDTQVEGRQADIYHIDMDHAVKVLSMQEDESEVQEVVEVVTTAKLITEVVAAISETVSAAAVIPSTKRPQTEAQARRNMMMYLKNTAGFTLDYFKGMSYDDIRPIFNAKFNSNMEFLLKSKEQIKEEESRAIAIINETPAQKAAKRRKLIGEAKEAESIKQHLQIVPDEDDDVFIEATPLARKVPVVDYQAILVNNKPRYKIIKADDTHQLYASFITMLKNFDREDLETLPDGQDNVWRNQSIVHGQALIKSWKLLTSYGVHIILFNTTQIILQVERRYPLTNFTLEQMLNVVRLQVEEESEMSLELIRFTKQQLQEGHHN
nr:hypothetical protein [Tanacetum cinerariifolium]GEZ69380.1 hypothetical protein [Tanacetum cinerariifolium]GEZ69389.1 hypothetical protein [Tanacetum cinerariifolium]